jgi:hypothetical protein
VPRDRFATRSDDGAHAPGHRIVGVDSQEIQVPFQGVALQSREVSFLCAQVTDWPGPERQLLLERNRRWRCVGCALEEHIRLLHPGGVPRHLCTAGDLIDAQAYALEDFCDRHSALPHHLCQGLRVRAVGALSLRGDGIRRGVESHQHPWLGLDERQATGELGARARERMGPGRIQDDNACSQSERCERAGVIRNSNRLGHDVRVTRYPGIDRDEVVLALELQAIAAQVDEYDRVRP